jgi:hypothetical protein
MRLTKKEQVALANFGGHMGCSGLRPVYQKIVAAGFLRHEYHEGSLHEHSFHWAPGGEEEAARIRDELAPKVLARLEPQALEALQACELHPQLVAEGLGMEMCRKTKPLMRTPLGKVVLELWGQDLLEQEARVLERHRRRGMERPDLYDDLRERFCYFAECQAATVEFLRGLKRTSKSELRRHESLLEKMLIDCRRHKIKVEEAMKWNCSRIARHLEPKEER